MHGESDRSRRLDGLEWLTDSSLDLDRTPCKAPWRAFESNDQRKVMALNAELPAAFMIRDRPLTGVMGGAMPGSDLNAFVD